MWSYIESVLSGLFFIIFYILCVSMMAKSNRSPEFFCFLFCVCVFFLNKSVLLQSVCDVNRMYPVVSFAASAVIGYFEDFRRARVPAFDVFD